MSERLVIKAYKEADYSGSAIGEFKAYVNPSEITLAYEVEYDQAQGAGTTNSPMRFKKMKPGDLTLALFLDGTGANGRPLLDQDGAPCSVPEKVKQFQSVTGYNGDIHRPNYLKIGWGTFAIKRCVLKSASVAYKLFDVDGIPLRAVITATFSDNADDKTRVATAQDQSSDLTHFRLVKAGDTLPSLCNEIYGNPGMYLRVARANELDDFRNLVPGTRLRFPPLEK